MADELGPLEGGSLTVGDLPARLTELMLAYAEFSRAAAPWLTGDVHVPLAQLTDLGQWAKALEASCVSVREEARRVYRETESRRAAA